MESIQQPLSCLCSNQIKLGEGRVLPQSILFLSTLLFQLQNPLFQPIYNLDHILRQMQDKFHFLFKSMYINVEAEQTHHTSFFFPVHKTSSILRSLKTKEDFFLKTFNIFEAQKFTAYFSRIQQFFYLLLSFGVILLQAA